MRLCGSPLSISLIIDGRNWHTVTTQTHEHPPPCHVIHSEHVRLCAIHCVSNVHVISRMSTTYQLIHQVTIHSVIHHLQFINYLCNWLNVCGDGSCECGWQMATRCTQLVKLVTHMQSISQPINCLVINTHAYTHRTDTRVPRRAATRLFDVAGSVASFGSLCIDARRPSSYSLSHKQSPKKDSK